MKYQGLTLKEIVYLVSDGLDIFSTYSLSLCVLKMSLHSLPVAMNDPHCWHLQYSGGLHHNLDFNLTALCIIFLGVTYRNPNPSRVLGFSGLLWKCGNVCGSVHKPITLASCTGEKSRPHSLHQLVHYFAHMHTCPVMAAELLCREDTWKLSLLSGKYLSKEFILLFCSL